MVALIKPGCEPVPIPPDDPKTSMILDVLLLHHMRRWKYETGLFSVPPGHYWGYSYEEVLKSIGRLKSARLVYEMGYKKDGTLVLSFTKRSRGQK